MVYEKLAKALKDAGADGEIDTEFLRSKDKALGVNRCAAEKLFALRSENNAGRDRRIWAGFSGGCETAEENSLRDRTTKSGNEQKCGWDCLRSKKLLSPEKRVIFWTESVFG